MPEVTDPNLLAQLNQGQPRPMGVQPMAFPRGPTMPQVRNSTVPQEISQANLGLNYNQDARAEVSLENDNERLRIAREKADAEKKAREANAGVDTTATQDQAVGHAIMLRDSLRVLNDVSKTAPEQIKPTWKEFGVAYLTGDDPTLTGLVQPEQRQRASNAYRGAVESAIWLMTGAAAPADQVQRIYSNIAPTAADKGPVLADKRRRLLEFINQAEARAGAAQLKLDGSQFSKEDLAALQEFKANLNLIYGDEKAGPEDKVQLSKDKITIPVPEEMQKEHLAFFNDPAHARGKLTLGDYLQFRKNLQDKYDYGEGQMDFPGLQKFIDEYNAGKPINFNIAPEERDLGMISSLIADASDSDVGAGLKSYASAMTLGAPELLAGKTGRIASELVDEAHPKSALAGEVLGSVAPGLALEKGLAKGAVKFLGKDAEDRAARIGADMLANAAQGGITEYNQTGDADNALLASAFGAGGSAAARGVTKGFAELKPKEFREGLEALGTQPILNDAGQQIGKIKATDMTTPQRMGGTGAEEFVQGFPGISPARQSAVADFNRHNSARVLARVGLELPKNIQPGQAANDYVSAALGNEYTKLAPKIRGRIDPNFTTAVAGIRNSVLPTPRRGVKVDPAMKELWQPLENAVSTFTKTGKFDFNSFKNFTQELREWQKYYATAQTGGDGVPSPMMNNMAREAEKLITQARALVSRVDPAAGARLKKIDSAYAHQMRIEMASRGAAKQERGVYAPNEYLNAIERMDTSKGKSATARGKAMDQPYGQSAMEVLGQKPTKGGSVLATGALGYSVGGAMLSPALAATYAPGIKRFTQALTDGRLGDKLDNLAPESLKKQFPELPTDVIKQLLAVYIREKAQGR